MTREDEEMLSNTEQAAQWWVLLRDGAASAAEKREFAEWLKRSPDRVEASLRIARAHSAVSRPDVGWPTTSAEQLIREAKAAPEDTVTPLRPGAVHRKPEVARRRPFVPVAIGLAASLLVAAGISWFSLTRTEQYQTKIGEQHSVMLADGSRVTLNTASKIEVRLRDHQRVVDLVQGEALFEVAHDVNRPFDVHVGNVVVRVVGTQFDIDRRATHTAVTVIEGKVSVVATGPNAQAIPQLTAADRVVVDSSGAGQVEHGMNPGDATAWTQRQLVFQRRPLGEIAEELNRYNVTRIEIRSPVLAEQRVTGTFRSDDVASFVAVLAGIPGVHVTLDSAGNHVVTVDDSFRLPE
jgi:transmembrane sensor